MDYIYMGETAITHLSERIHSVYQEAEEEFKHHIPPWSESDCWQRLKAVCYYTAIYSPMCLLISIIVSSYVLYVRTYIVMLLSGREVSVNLYYFHTDEEASWAETRGWICLIAMTWFLVLFFISYYRAVMTSPGRIPLTSLWEIPSEGGSDEDELIKKELAQEEHESRLIERRRDGGCRTCTYCHLRKPDRTHHCKQCESCVLVMDHHCNWIANCVGYCNFKYFFLMVFYGMLMTQLFVGSYWECVLVLVNDPETSVVITLASSATYTFFVLLSCTLTAFFSFHLWLLWKNYSTIEFCEKRRAKLPNYMTSPFDRGAFANFKHSLGRSIWTWPFPFWYRRELEGGLYFK